MKVAPVSADLLIKLGIVAGLGVGAWILLQRAKAALPTLPDWDFEMPTPTWQWVNPASDQNLIYQGTSGVVSAAVGRDETLGGLLAEWFDPTTRAANQMLNTPPVVNTGGATGSWDYEPAYQPDGTSAAPYFGA